MLASRVCRQVFSSTGPVTLAAGTTGTEAAAVVIGGAMGEGLTLPFNLSIAAAYSFWASSVLLISAASRYCSTAPLKSSFFSRIGASFAMILGSCGDNDR